MQGQLVVTDVLGRELVKKEIFSGTTECNWNDLPAGIYQLIFRADGKQQASEKMIIQK